MLAFEQKKADVMPTAEVIALKKVKENRDMEIKGLVTRSWSAIGVRRGEGFTLAGRAVLAESRGCSLMAV